MSHRRLACRPSRGGAQFARRLREVAAVDTPRYAPRVIRFVFTLLIVGVLVFLGATVKLGKRTFFGHVSAIWSTDEAKDMREGVSEKAAPVVEKVKRGVEAGYKEATKDAPADAGVAPAPAR